MEFPDQVDYAISTVHETVIQACFLLQFSPDMQFLVLLASLVGLWLGTEATIKGAVAIADRLHISEFIIGVVVLSIGSDLPELAVAVHAALENLRTGQASDIVIGSALGSALGQIGFVLGVVGMMASLTLPKRIVRRHGGVLLGALIVLGLTALDGSVSRSEGLSLIAIYVIYLVFIVPSVAVAESQEADHGGLNLLFASVYLIIGLAIVVGSAELTVSSATALAGEHNIDKSFIAIVIVGLGSSLPEFSISFVAALKHRVRMSVGNLIGSNIFDTLVPVGIAAVIAELKFRADLLRYELPILFALSVVVLILFYRTKGIQKREAAIILGLYIGYIAVELAHL